MSDRRPRALALLLDALIDYAGLFPPAALGMAEAVDLFARYRYSPNAWALGRFVVPVARLDEFERAVSSLDNTVEPVPGGATASPWPLTVLSSLPLEADLARIEAFNAAHQQPGARWTAAIESLEVKATSAIEILRAGEGAPGSLEIFFEVPVNAAIDDLCDAAASSRRGLKLRTGGPTPDSFPPSAVVARFLAASIASRVPFKATAGLHHPVRSAHPISGETGAPSVMMHGFLNLFVAAALLVAGKADAALATQVLEDEVPASFVFDDEGVAWRGQRLTLGQLSAARQIARSFGSCSFEEPFQMAGVLPAPLAGRTPSLQ